ncbi:hypothetical protein Tco_1326843 [Tanacetum coccineum]
MDHLEKHLSKEEFQEIESSSAFRVLLQQFQTFIYLRFSFDTEEGLMIRKYFIAYTKNNVPLFHDKLYEYMESLQDLIQEIAKHKREYERWMNDRMMQSKEGNVDLSKALDAGLVVTESNETESKRHISSSRSGKDTHAEDADINFVNDKQPLAENVAQLQKDLSRMEAHCVNMELKYQNQALKDGQHGQILNETSNKAKIKKKIEVLEKINIQLEHSVAKLLAENEKLHKENEHLKLTYKDLYDSIKMTREKVFAHVALKNELRKLKGKSMDTKESTPAKPHHVNAPSSSRNSQKESYGSNDMAHKYYLEEAKKKGQERDKKSTTSVMPSAKSYNTTKTCKSKPRSNNQTSGVLPTSKSSCPTITAMPKANHSRSSSPFSYFKHFVCSTVRSVSLMQIMIPV